MEVLYTMDDGTKGVIEFDVVTALEAAERFRRDNPSYKLIATRDSLMSVFIRRDGPKVRTVILSDGGKIYHEEGGLRIV